MFTCHLCDLGHQPGQGGLGGGRQVVFSQDCKQGTNLGAGGTLENTAPTSATAPTPIPAPTVKTGVKLSRQ